MTAQNLETGSGVSIPTSNGFIPTSRYNGLIIRGNGNSRNFFTVAPMANLTFPVIFLFERSPNFSPSQSPILSLAIIIKSNLLEAAKSLKPLFYRRFQT